MEMKVNIKRCFYELWKKRNIIILTVIFSILVGIYMMLNVDEVGNYTATTSIYSVVYGSYDETVTEQTNLAEFSAIVGSSNVARRAATMLDNEYINDKYIQDMFSIDSNGNILYVHSYAYDAELAVNVANAVAEAFVVEYKNLTGAENIQVFEKAQQANSYGGDNNNKKMTMIIYTGVGFFLVCLIIVIHAIFSAKIQDFSECNMDGDIEILAVIPEGEVKK